MGVTMFLYVCLRLLSEFTSMTTKNTVNLILLTVLYSYNIIVVIWTHRNLISIHFGEQRLLLYS